MAYAAYASLGYLLGLLLFAGCDRVQSASNGSDHADVPRTSGLQGFESCEFEVCTQFTRVELDQQWMLLLLDAVDQSGARSEVISQSLGAETTQLSDWEGLAWGREQWTAVVLASGSSRDPNRAAQFYSGEFGVWRWANVDTSEVEVWRDGDQAADTAWKMRFATFEEKWRLARNPEVGFIRVVSRLSWDGAPVAVKSVNVEGSTPAGLGQVFFGWASCATPYGESKAWLAWCESIRNPEMRIWVAAWGLVGKSHYRLIAGRAASTPWPDLAAPDPARLGSLYPVELRFLYH